MQVDRPNPIGTPQLLYWFRYSNGITKYMTFPTKKEAEWFIHNEGDHLLEAKLIID